MELITTRFRKKPIEIEALKWTGRNQAEMEEFCPKARFSTIYIDGKGHPEQELEIPTLEGILVARIGDMIIKGVEGEFYPCRNDIFWKTYDRVD